MHNINKAHKMKFIPDLWFYCIKIILKYIHNFECGWVIKIKISDTTKQMIKNMVFVFCPKYREKTFDVYGANNILRKR